MVGKQSALTAIALCLVGVRCSSGLDLKVTLGEKNIEAGLHVPSESDGANVPETVGGLSARRAAAPADHFFYVTVNWPDAAARSSDVYVIVEAYDDNLHQVRVQYDKDAATPTVATKYIAADQVILLTGTGRWRKTCVFLPSLRLGHEENLGADFRIVANGAALHSIEVTTTKPAGFDANQPVAAESLRAIHVDRPPGIELTLGTEVTPAQAAIFRALGATSAETYVDWAATEPVENEWDWSKWDQEAAAIQAQGLKWAPLLIAGPAYATPLWFQNGPHSDFARCLEHGQDTRIQSIFNPDLRPAIERFLQAFAKRYRDTGVLESVLLGVSGTYGESLYPAGTVGWTAKLTGDYHVHNGWWIGDRFAVADFRKTLQQNYPDLTALNTAWKTHYASYDEIAPFLPEAAPSDAARAYLVSWYQQAMTGWAAFWASAARKAFPQTEIYLCTGGNGDPMLGADFTAQAEALAPFGVGMRVTNQGNNYYQNFNVTREVATATRFFGTFFGVEPAIVLSPPGVSACIYNAASSGARGIFFYDNGLLGTRLNRENFQAYAPLLTTRHPQVDLALYLSRESWEQDARLLREFYLDSSALRAYADHDYVTHRSVNAGILKNYRVLVLTDSPVLRPEAADVIERWVEEGGVLIGVTRKSEPLGGRLYNGGAWRERLFAHSSNEGGRSSVARVKKGYTVLIDDSDHSPLMAQSLMAALHESPAHLSGLRPRELGGAPATLPTTKTREGTLWFNPPAGKIGSE